jgi:signal transduction histidine kinase
MADQRQITILVIDDSATSSNVTMLAPLLQQHGYNVLSTYSNTNLLNQLTYHQPDMLLLDAVLAACDGLNLCEQIKQHPQFQELPIILITALTDPDAKIRGLQAGAADYITKPFQPAEVLVRIKLHLRLYQLTRQLAQQNTELSQTNTQLEATIRQQQHELQQFKQAASRSKRLSLLGQLTAGLAHEINNPLNFITLNLYPIREHIQTLINVLEYYERMSPELLKQMPESLHNLDLDNLKRSLLKTVNWTEEGAKQLVEIVRSLRTFARSDSQEKTAFDLHQGLESSLRILSHRLKANAQRPEIQINRCFGTLPSVLCYPGQLSQVFMNLLTNAIDALDEASHLRHPSELKLNPCCITITTAWLPEKQEVTIRIGDNGIGMPEAIQQKVFEYSFTTKAVGKGTGLGLTICRQIIEEHHNGSIRFWSVAGQQTEFEIRLPASTPMLPSAPSTHQRAAIPLNPLHPGKIVQHNG